MREAMPRTNIDRRELQTGRHGPLNVVIETPGGSRNKFTYDERLGLFRLHKILPMGFRFPFDFGFVPGTLAADGDPLDVMVLGEEPTFAGCIVSVRLLGVIEATQTAKGKTIRNDRLIATPESEKISPTFDTIKDVPARVLDQIEHFFIAYNQYEDRVFRILKREGRRAAVRLVAEARRKRRGGREKRE